VETCPSTPLEEGWGTPVNDERQAEWSASDSKVLVSYPSCNHSWPSIKGGVEVAIEVCLDAMELERECSACRSLMIIDCLSVPDLLSLLCHNAIGTSFGSCVSSGCYHGVD
jgi:hypothetical protein